jgi:hypothetical protein
MRSRYLLFIVAFLSASLFIGTSLLAQQKPDSTSIIDTTSMIPSADSTITDSIQRAADSLLILQKKKSIRDTASYKKLMTHPYLPMQTKPSFRINELRIAPNFWNALLFGIYKSYIPQVLFKCFSTHFPKSYKAKANERAVAAK